MDEQTKLILASYQVDNLFQLFKGNEWETYLTRDLYKIKYEIARQLSLYKPNQ